MAMFGAHLPRRLAALSMIATLFSGCSEPERAERASDDSGEEDDTGELPPAIEIDEDALLAELLDYKNRLEPIGSGPEELETHADAAHVEVWATPGVAELFDTIDPMDPSQAIEFERGVTFVKEHYDEDGNMFGINVMYKGPEGYDPNNADWVWLLSRDDAATQFGRVEFCQECHSAARNSDFVIGFGKSE